MKHLKDTNPIDDFDFVENYNKDVKEISENVQSNINQNINNQNKNNNDINISNDIKEDNSPNPIVETIYVNEKFKKKQEPVNQDIENINIIPGQYYMKNSHDNSPPVNQTSNNNL